MKFLKNSHLNQPFFYEKIDTPCFIQLYLKVGWYSANDISLNGFENLKILSIWNIALPLFPLPVPGLARSQHRELRWQKARFLERNSWLDQIWLLFLMDVENFIRDGPFREDLDPLKRLKIINWKSKHKTKDDERYYCFNFKIDWPKMREFKALSQVGSRSRLTPILIWFKNSKKFILWVIVSQSFVIYTYIGSM
jgi:hypothetical protein